jgi:hypothetical protein
MTKRFARDDDDPKNNTLLKAVIAFVKEKLEPDDLAELTAMLDRNDPSPTSHHLGIGNPDVSSDPADDTFPMPGGGKGGAPGASDRRLGMDAASNLKSLAARYPHAAKTRW